MLSVCVSVYAFLCACVYVYDMTDHFAGHSTYIFVVVVLLRLYSELHTRKINCIRAGA